MKFLRHLSETLLGKKISGIRIAPLTTKIIFVFTIFILASNFASHYISLMRNRAVMVDLMKQMLVKDLKEIYNIANTQHQIYQFNKDLKTSVENIENKALVDFKKQKSVLLGVTLEGKLLMQASSIKKHEKFSDSASLKLMRENLEKKVFEGFLTIQFNGEEYFTVYKYNPKWEAFFIRGEEFNEFYEDSNRIFRQNMWDILIITLISIIIGIFLMRYILRFVREITAAILQMTENQQLEIIDVGRAPGDDITFLGVAFNALSNTIGTLLNIFRKFTNKDIVQKAYEERIIKLEGSSRELTCLFSDIKSFTYMTETLGTDIITLLNLHYTKAINEILVRDGIIGSIIGDALLAVYGALDGAQENKSYQALLSAYAIGEVALNIRKRMTAIRDKLIAERGALSERDEKAYKAVLIEVGVGIDGGMVFYGNIGSHERMTNTVIGDNVNSASRLEGLTRIYQVPVICSEYVKDDIINNVSDHRVRFIELDTVQVKGKTIGKKVYWPVMERDVDEQLEKDLTNFSQGLKLYYEGDWKGAFKTFSLCSFSLKDVFIERTEENTCPEDWNGIWAMTTK